MQPKKLAEDIDPLNTKAKEMMPNEVGVPVGGYLPVVFQE